MPVKMINICICTCCLEEKKGSDFGQRYLGQRKVNSFKSIILFLILVFSTTIKVKAGNICLRTLYLDLIIVSFVLFLVAWGLGLHQLEILGFEENPLSLTWKYHFLHFIAQVSTFVGLIQLNEQLTDAWTLPSFLQLPIWPSPPF